MKQLVLALSLAASAMMSGCITSPGPGGGPPPVARVDAARLYTGQWHEIAFRPNWLLEGCVAGITRYTPKTEPNQVQVRDSCRDKTLDGPEKVVEGPGHILDPGANAKIRADYFLFVSRETWIAALGDDYSWFISADPRFEKLWIYTRQVPSDAERAALVERARALGYDVSRLEFPAF